MARNETFLEIYTMLREELGRSSDVSIGVDDLPSLKRAVNRAYATIYEEHDWPFLRRVFPTVSLSAGQQHYDMPASLNVERIECVNVWHNGQPHEIERGISFEDYAVYDPASDERVDPVLKWDVRDVTGVAMIEVWPLPATDTMTMQFIGIRELPKLVNDADVCLLDDELVVLLATAQLLRRQKSADADDILAQFRARFQTLKGRSSTGASKRIRLGLGASSEETRRRSRAHITISG